MKMAQRLLFHEITVRVVLFEQYGQHLSEQYGQTRVVLGCLSGPGIMAHDHNHADDLLQVARDELADGEVDRGRKLLELIVVIFPDSSAATEARDLLENR